MARNTGVVYCAYEIDGVQLEASEVRTDEVAIFTSKMTALEHAVDNGWSFCPWPQGLTLREAIAAHVASKTPKPAAVKEPTASRLAGKPSDK